MKNFKKIVFAILIGIISLPVFAQSNDESLSKESLTRFEEIFCLENSFYEAIANHNKEEAFKSFNEFINYYEINDTVIGAVELALTYYFEGTNTEMMIYLLTDDLAIFGVESEEKESKWRREILVKMFDSKKTNN